MVRLLIELVEDIRFEHGAWHPVDEPTQALTDALARSCKGPQRAFTRAAAALDRERVALGHPADLPDLNKFYVVEGDAAKLSGLPLVADVSPIEPIAPVPAPEGLPEGTRVVHADPGRVLADQIDHMAAGLGDDDLVVIPVPISGRAAWGAAELAARRGVHVVAVAAGEPPAWVRQVVVVRPDELAAAAHRAYARGGRGRRVRVTLETFRLMSGGDRGKSEIYFEGLIKDAVERKQVRVPSSGAIERVEHGASVTVNTVLHDGVRQESGDLAIHLEVWDEDLGKESLLDPDDLIGSIDARFGEAERWGEGVHTLRTHDGDGDCEVTFSIELLHGTA